MAVPCVPRNRESRPAITSAAMRPCLLAGPANAIRLHSPVTKSFTSTASPTAKISGSLVHICSSTRIPPRAPISSPAILASVASGRTPMASITRSAVYCFPDFVSTWMVLFSPALKPDTPSESAICIPCIFMYASTMCAFSLSKGNNTWSAISTRVTSKPRCIRFSAISKPIKPPPITTPRGFGLIV